jgi:hypothetical protein
LDLTGGAIKRHMQHWAQNTGRSQTKKKKTQTNHSITKKVKEMIGLQREIAKQKYLT